MQRHCAVEKEIRDSPITSYKLQVNGLTASQVVRLIGLLLVVRLYHAERTASHQSNYKI